MCLVHIKFLKITPSASVQFVTHLPRSRIVVWVDLHVYFHRQQHPKCKRAVRLMYPPFFCKRRFSSIPPTRINGLWSGSSNNSNSLISNLFSSQWLILAPPKILIFPSESPCIYYTPSHFSRLWFSLAQFFFRVLYFSPIYVNCIFAWNSECSVSIIITKKSIKYKAIPLYIYVWGQVTYAIWRHYLSNLLWGKKKTNCYVHSFHCDTH